MDPDVLKNIFASYVFQCLFESNKTDRRTCRRLVERTDYALDKSK